MARRRSLQTGISLFAFQDIITSVSGILIVFTLILALDIENATAPAQNASPVATATQERELTLLRERRDELTAEIKDQAELIRQMNQLPNKDPKQRRAEIQTRQQEIDEQQKETREKLAQLERNLNSRKASRADAETRLRAAAKEDPSEIVNKRIAGRKRAITELDAEIAAAKTENRIVYSMPKGDPRTGWIVEVGRNGMAVGPIGKETKPEQFTSEEAFLDWVSRLPRGESYVYFAVRPSGIKRFQSLESRLAGQDYGFELVGEDQVVLDNESGAQ